ncbi:unnamed protein product [Darwinula stevensoni]|uniref:EF-hand domain-containing protein n=1 Tax=Darwinula stevensoni TaxID=69355 RepID=A0A7R8X8X7_9CRUS|nr:unnamed protein product [Darwinula stevensoni]CAG0888561.1 unnamed protein product [Darwinula stevensoni]
MARFLRRSFKKKKAEVEVEDWEPHSVRYKPDGIDQLSKTTKFSRKELQLMYRSFKQECPTGVVDEDKFKAIYSQFFPQGDASQYAHYVFNAFDTEHTGSISFEEFVEGLSILSRGSVQDKLQWAFQLYDIDGDGLLTRNEMEEIVTSVYNLLGRHTQPCVDENSARQHVDRIFEGCGSAGVWVSRGVGQQGCGSAGVWVSRGVGRKKGREGFELGKKTPIV